MVVTDIYTSDEYLKRNPLWHVEDSQWKAAAILKLMQRNNIHPQTICEIGCGAAEILKILQQEMDDNCTFLGYDIAPQAIELAKLRENARLHAKVGDFNREEQGPFDLLLIIDVLAHLEDAFGFLRTIKPKSEYKIFQFAFDVSVLSVFKNQTVEYRRATRHLHFFTKDIMLDMLRDEGYEIIDSFYTIRPFTWASWNQFKRKPHKLPFKLIKQALYRWPRKFLYAINQDLAVRVYGEWRFIVLTK